MLRRLIMFVVCLPLSGLSQAGYFDGMFAFDRGEYDRALSEWRAAAKLGEPKSLYGLAQLYEEGLGVQPDPVSAWVYYDLSAAEGYSRAAKARDALGAKLDAAGKASAAATSKRLQAEGKFLIDEAGGIAVAAAEPPPEPEPAAVPEPEPAAVPEPEPAAVPEPEPAAVPEPEPAVTPESESTGKEAPAPSAVEPRPRRLDLAFACDLEQRWSDRGSGGDRDLAVYDPVTPQGYRMIGGYVQGNYSHPDNCVYVVREGEKAAGAGPSLLVKPAGWQMVWADKGTGADQDGSVWRALPPNADYVCLGHVGQGGYAKPRVPNYACVHSCLVIDLRPTRSVWNDSGTGGRSAVSIYRLYASGSFVAVPSRKQPASVADLNPFGVCREGG